jgi:hypothetical protein
MHPYNVSLKRTVSNERFLQIAYQSALKHKVVNYQNLEAKDQKMIQEIFTKGLDSYQYSHTELKHENELDEIQLLQQETFNYRCYHIIQAALIAFAIPLSIKYK